MSTEEQKAKRREYLRKYRESPEARERLKASCRKYRAAHREEINERERMRRASRKDEVREMRRKWREKHKDEINAKKRKWRSENRETLNARQRETSKKWRDAMRLKNPKKYEAYLFLSKCQKMDMYEKFAHDPSAYADFRKRCRKANAEHYRKKHPEARLYLPKPSMRIPDSATFGQNGMDKTSTFIRENLTQQDRASAKVFNLQTRYVERDSNRQMTGVKKQL